MTVVGLITSTKVSIQPTWRSVAQRNVLQSGKRKISALSDIMRVLSVIGLITSGWWFHNRYNCGCTSGNIHTKTVMDSFRVPKASGFMSSFHSRDWYCGHWPKSDYKNSQRFGIWNVSVPGLHFLTTPPEWLLSFTFSFEDGGTYIIRNAVVSYAWDDGQCPTFQSQILSYTVVGELNLWVIYSFVLVAGTA
jgi:hypothetical protein